MTGSVQCWTGRQMAKFTRQLRWAKAPGNQRAVSNKIRASATAVVPMLQSGTRETGASHRRVPAPDEFRLLHGCPRLHPVTQ